MAEEFLPEEGAPLRIPLLYSRKVIELFKSPKNLGKINDPDATAYAGSPVCGDMIAIYLKVGEGEVVEKATFESYGCAANIAAASILTETATGKKLEEAWKISWKEVTKELGGLPSVKYHCGVLAVGALRRAIRNYYAKKGDIPPWLSSELTLEEKHALEEEELAKVLEKRLKA